MWDPESNTLNYYLLNNPPKNKEDILPVKGNIERTISCLIYIFVNHASPKPKLKASGLDVWDYP